jgi:hypothetical protein
MVQSLIPEKYRIEDTLNWDDFIDSESFEELIMQIQEDIYRDMQEISEEPDMEDVYDDVGYDDIPDDHPPQEEDSDNIICPVCCNNVMIRDDSAALLCCPCGAGISLTAQTPQQVRGRLSDLFDRHYAFCIANSAQQMQHVLMETDSYSMDSIPAPTTAAAQPSGLTITIHSGSLQAHCPFCGYSDIVF